MKAVTLGLQKEALLIRPQDKTILTYLKHLDRGNSAKLKDIQEREVHNYDNVSLFHGQTFLASASMKDLESMIPEVNSKSSLLIEARCGEEDFVYLVHQAFFRNSFVGGYLTDYRELSPIVALSKSLWTVSMKRLIKVESQVASKLTSLTLREIHLYYNHLKRVMLDIGAYAYIFADDAVYFLTTTGTIQYDFHLRKIMNSRNLA